MVETPAYYFLGVGVGGSYSISDLNNISSIIIIIGYFYTIIIIIIVIYITFPVSRATTFSPWTPSAPRTTMTTTIPMQDRRVNNRENDRHYYPSLPR